MCIGEIISRLLRLVQHIYLYNWNASHCKPKAYESKM